MLEIISIFPKNDNVFLALFKIKVATWLLRTVVALHSIELYGIKIPVTPR